MIVAAAGLLAAACSDSASLVTELTGPAAEIFTGDCVAGTGEEVTIYSGRDQELIQSVLDAFECSTGIATVTNFGDPTDLALLLVEEGDRTPADVFLSKSPGAVGFLQNQGILSELNSDIISLVNQDNSATNNTWVGVTGRQRVLVYNVDQVAAPDLPESIFDLTDERFRGQVAIPAGNGSFQDWFTVFRAQIHLGLRVPARYPTSNGGSDRAEQEADRYETNCYQRGRRAALGEYASCLPRHCSASQSGLIARRDRR